MHLNVHINLILNIDDTFFLHSISLIKPFNLLIRSLYILKNNIQFQLLKIIM